MSQRPMRHLGAHEVDFEGFHFEIFQKARNFLACFNENKQKPLDNLWVLKNLFMQHYTIIHQLCLKLCFSEENFQFALKLARSIFPVKNLSNFTRSKYLQ